MSFYLVGISARKENGLRHITVDGDDLPNTVGFYVGPEHLKTPDTFRQQCRESIGDDLTEPDGDWDRMLADVLEECGE